MFNLEVYYSDKKVQNKENLTKEQTLRWAYVYGFVPEVVKIDEIKQQKTLRFGKSKNNKIVIIRQEQN